VSFLINNVALLALFAAGSPADDQLRVALLSGHPDEVSGLGASLPTGIPCVELIVASYGALAMQNVMVDERDAAGVLNIEAARWWQANTHRIPLTKTPLLSPAVQTEEGKS